MKKRLSSLVLALVMGLALTVPALAAEISVQWLTVAGEPYAYNETFGWITLKGDDGSYRMVDLISINYKNRRSLCPGGFSISPHQTLGRLCCGRSVTENCMKKSSLPRPQRTWAALFSLKIWWKGKIP